LQIAEAKAKQISPENPNPSFLRMTKEHKKIAKKPFSNPIIIFFAKI
jgi:hypothetical protein